MAPSGVDGSTGEIKFFFLFDNRLPQFSNDYRILRLSIIGFGTDDRESSTVGSAGRPYGKNEKPRERGAGAFCNNRGRPRCCYVARENVSKDVTIKKVLQRRRGGIRARIITAAGDALSRLRTRCYIIIINTYGPDMMFRDGGKSVLKR